jgi:hypothetical protein
MKQFSVLQLQIWLAGEEKMPLFLLIGQPAC